MIKYLKDYFEPDSKKLNKEALESAKKYFEGRPRYTITIDQWIRYQTAYKDAYRHRYAKDKLDAMKGV